MKNARKTAKNILYVVLILGFALAMFGITSANSLLLAIGSLVIIGFIGLL